MGDAFAHLDPEKAAQDPFGKKLLQLKEFFSEKIRLATDRSKSAVENAKKTGVPEEAIKKIFLRAGLPKRRNPSLEKLLFFANKIILQPELSRAEAIRKLRDAIRNADSRTSQKEINLLADSLAALENAPVKYRPALHVTEYLELRRRVQQKRRRV